MHIIISSNPGTVSAIDAGMIFSKNKQSIIDANVNNRNLVALYSFFLNPSILVIKYVIITHSQIEADSSKTFIRIFTWTSTPYTYL